MVEGELTNFLALALRLRELTGLDATTSTSVDTIVAKPTIALLVAPARDSGWARVSFVTSKPLAVIVSCNGAF